MTSRTNELVLRWQQHRDRAARAELVRLYTPLVKRLVRRYPGAQAHVEDARQEAMLGLLVAIDRFDPSRGTAFGSYATLWIRCHVLDFTKRASQVRRIANRESRRLFYSIGRYSRELARQGRDASAEAIAELAGTRLDVVHTVLGHVHQQDVELDAPREGGGVRSDLFATRDALPDELVDEAREGHRRALVLAHAMAGLSERERLVVRLRRLEEPARTLQEIGDQLGISRERVRQIEARALDRLERAARAAAPAFSTTHRPAPGTAKPSTRAA